MATTTDNIPTCANPLYLKWIGEWLEIEKERGTRRVKTYKNAYVAVKACPLTFNHPSEASQLKGIGEKLVKMLTQKMEEFCAENGLPKLAIPKGKKRVLATGEESEDEDVVPSPKKKKTVKTYVPKFRSGAYALIIALSSLDQDDSTGLTKQQTTALAEEHSDTSFTAPQHANGFYTAWNSMKTLLDKNLVYTKGRPSKKYLLTEEGWEVARSFKKANDPSLGRLDTFVERRSESPCGQRRAGISTESGHRSQSPEAPRSPITKATAADIIPRGDSSALPHFEPIIIPPGSYTIHLVLDNREVRAKTDRHHMQREFEKKGITAITRGLTLGDITWVAKVHDPTMLSSLGGDIDEGDEVILDWIIERKRLDDLISSVKEGRFQEQKFRMRKSGIKNVIYLVEEHNLDGDQLSKTQSMVESVKTSLQVVDGYFLKETRNMDETIRYLCAMTTMLQNDIYKNKELYVIPSRVITATNHLPLINHLRKTQSGIDFHLAYSAFAALVSKSGGDTLRDVYLKMLMCTRGVTGEKALEMQKIWKTPIELVEAYESCGDDEKGKLKKMNLVTSEMNSLIARKKIGKALSLGISKVWGGTEDE